MKINYFTHLWEILDVDTMSEKEQEAIWTLILYTKRRQILPKSWVNIWWLTTKKQLSRYRSTLQGLGHYRRFLPWNTQLKL